MEKSTQQCFLDFKGEACFVLDFSLSYCFQKPSGTEHYKTMPRAKERKQKPKGAPPSVVPVLQKFLKTYQKYCVQSRTSPCPAIQRDLKSSIDREQILRRVSGGTLSFSEIDSLGSVQSRLSPSSALADIHSLAHQTPRACSTLLPRPRPRPCPPDCQNVFAGPE